MKTLTLGNHTLLLIPVPDKVVSVRLWELANNLSVRVSPEDFLAWHNDPLFTRQFAEWHPYVHYNLPPGKWRYINISSEISEEQCAQLVEEANPELIDMPGYKHYRDYRSQGWEDNFSDAVPAFFSFLQSNSIEDTVAILLKEE